VSPTFAGVRQGRLRFLRLSREFALIASGQLLVALGGIVGVRLLTQVLTPAIYGEIALGMTLALLAQQTLLSPLAVAFLRFFSPERQARRVRAYANGVLRLLAQAALLVAFMALGCVVGLVGLGQTQWIGLTIVAAVLSLLAGYGAAVDSIQNAARHRLLVVAHQVTDQWARFVVAFALIWFFEKSSAMVLAAYALVAALILCSQSRFLAKKLGPLITADSASADDSAEIVARMRRYALPFATWGVFTWAFEASGRWALQFFQGTTSVGLYAALWQVGQYPMILVSDAIAATVAPVLFARAGDGSDQLRLKRAQGLNTVVVGCTFGITLIGVLVGYGFKDRIIGLVVGPRYREIAPLLPWAMLAGGLFGSAQVAVLRILMTADTRVLIAPKIGTAIAGILLKVAGAYLMGLSGVVAATVMFSILYLVWVMALNRRSSERSVSPWRWRPGMLARGGSIDDRV
jgi:O-antigen/teichoic acid export membrane protein